MKNKPNFSGFCILFYVMLVLYINAGCIPFFRSARGLNPGEVQVSYNAPFAGNIRIGLAKNIEYRYSIIGESHQTDLSFHLHNKLDYLFSIGGRWNAENYSDVGYAIIISKNYYKRFNPYLGYTAFVPQEGDLKGAYKQVFGLGLEIYLWKENSHSFNLALIPEGNFFPNYNIAGIEHLFFGSLGIALNYDF